MLELPQFAVEGIRSVAGALARKLPAGSLTAQELVLFLGSRDADLSRVDSANRATSSTVRCLPPAAVGPRRFLDLSSIHPLVLRIVDYVSVMSSQEGQSDSGSSPLCRRLQRDLLCRGYAEGLRAVLSRYVPTLHEMRRDRPHLTVPWAVIRREAPYTAKVAFTRVDLTGAASDVLLAARSSLR